MKQFSYTVKDPVGIHARPAGLLVKLVKGAESSIKIEKEDGKSADMKKLMALMGLGVKCGSTVKVTVDGPDEDSTVESIEKFFSENL